MEKNAAAAGLLGKSFDCAFDMFTPRLRFHPGGLHLLTTEGAVQIDETVEAHITALQPQLLMLHWVESSGVFVVHIHDYVAMKVHSVARLPDGQILAVDGTLQPVTD